jgi:hypothetical protein
VLVCRASLIYGLALPDCDFQDRCVAETDLARDSAINGEEQVTHYAMWFRQTLQIVETLAKRTGASLSLTAGLRAFFLVAARCKAVMASVPAFCAWMIRERSTNLSRSLSGWEEGDGSITCSETPQISFADCIYCGTTHIALQTGRGTDPGNEWLCMRCGSWNREVKADVVATLPSHTELFGANPMNDSAFDANAILQHEADLVFAQNFSAIAD